MKRRYVATLCFAALFIAGIAADAEAAAAQMAQDLLHLMYRSGLFLRAQWDAFRQAGRFRHS